MSIEERAQEYAELAKIRGDMPFELAEDVYKEIATEQKKIDDAELAILEKAWEKKAEVNHDAAIAYNQGYHDAIEKACDWFGNYLMEIGYPDDWMRDSKVQLSGEQRFRKAMEEE